MRVKADPASTRPTTSTAPVTGLMENAWLLVITEKCRMKEGEVELEEVSMVIFGEITNYCFLLVESTLIHLIRQHH